MSWQTAATIGSVAVPLLALVGGLIGWWSRSLRREDVHAWADRSISALQTVVLLASLPPGRIAPDEFDRRLTDAIFETSILVEQGRLFFRNTPRGRYGREKPRAYRGFRPAVLDCLIAAHQAALRLKGADARTRAQMSLVAEDALKDFVSRLQHEVGRSRTASPAAGKAGESIDIARLASRLKPGRVDERMAEGRGP